MRWEWILGFPGYEISEVGEIYSERRGVLTTQLNHAGYRRTILVDAFGRRQSLRVCRLMCLNFYGLPPAPTYEASHRNGKRDDDRLENLRWLSREDNIRERELHGTAIPSEWLPWIRDSRESGISLSEISRITGFSRKSLRLKAWQL